MNLDVSHIKEAKFDEPMVFFPLRQYDELMEYMEDMEARLSIKESENKPVYDFKKLVKKLDKKHGIKRIL